MSSLLGLPIIDDLKLNGVTSKRALRCMLYRSQRYFEVTLSLRLDRLCGPSYFEQRGNAFGREPNVP